MATSKQIDNRKKFTKEYKVKEIQKNLTKKARLRKEYLKVLKEEGYSVPEKNPDTVKTYDAKKAKEERILQGKKRYDEKKEIKRQRKLSQKEQAELRKDREVERIKMAKEKQVDREKRKRRMTQKTKSGQPKMGPKINDLLDKIKGDDTYTR